MKKYMPIFLAVFIGIVFGNLIFSSYKTEEVMASYGNVYMLQYGAYTEKEVLEESIKKLEKDSYIVVLENNIYYLYLGITTDYFNALNIQKIYDNKNIFLYIKQHYIGNSLLINEIKKSDDLIKNFGSSKEIIDEQKKILAFYENFM